MHEILFVLFVAAAVGFVIVYAKAGCEYLSCVSFSKRGGPSFRAKFRTVASAAFVASHNPKSATRTL